MTGNPKALLGLFSLDHQVKLYIPSTRNVSEAADNSEHVRAALDLFAERFGGATTYAAVGAWKSAAEGLVKEDVQIVEAYASGEAIDASIADVIALAGRIKAAMTQEAIALEYDRQLFFI